MTEPTTLLKAASADHPHAEGQCLCGAVRFRFALPSKWVAHCHCTLCQRAHGAGFVTWVGARSEATEILDPDGALRWYSSSPRAERGFCSRCGSPMVFRSQDWPGEFHFARALVTSPLDREPMGHVFYDSHVS